jgi:hypothetical protein
MRQYFEGLCSAIKGPVARPNTSTSASGGAIDNVAVLGFRSARQTTNHGIPGIFLPWCVFEHRPAHNSSSKGWQSFPYLWLFAAVTCYEDPPPRTRKGSSQFTGHVGANTSFAIKDYLAIFTSVTLVECISNATSPDFEPLPFSY